MHEYLARSADVESRPQNPPQNVRYADYFYVELEYSTTESGPNQKQMFGVEGHITLLKLEFKACAFSGRNGRRIVIANRSQ
jgi:hypothetical protein